MQTDEKHQRYLVQGFYADSDGGQSFCLVQIYISNVKKVGDIDLLKWGDNVVELDLIIDGGNVVKCGNKIVMTEKVFVENCNISHEEVIKRLTDAFQCEIVFIPWDYMHEKLENLFSFHN